jgi:hypothetical protein
VPKTIPFSYHTQGVAETILADIDYFSKPVIKFLSTLISQWWGVYGRYNFMNLSRYVSYSEQALRNGFARGFDFLAITHQLVQTQCSQEKAIVFDPTFISKSGKKTDGIGYFWSGTSQKVMKGLEIGCLGVVDIINKTAFHLEAIQSPASSERKKKGISLIEHYRDFLLERIGMLKSISSYLLVDGYFMKKEFVLPIIKQNLNVITKMRRDANLRYTFQGKQRSGRGRKKKYAGKVNLDKLDKSKWDKVFETKTEICFTAILYCITLKRNCRIVYLSNKEHHSYEVFLGTDDKMKAEKLLKYYRLRYQVEFLIRDAKQHAGLEDCQARDKMKLNFHFNLCLTNVSIAKAEYYLPIPIKERDSFSLQNIKRLQHNKLLTDLIFANLELDLNCKKIKQLYLECINFGRMAA